MIRIVGLLLGCVLLLLPKTPFAGFMISGGGKVTVTEGDPGSLSYSVKNKGGNPLKVFVAPEKADPGELIGSAAFFCSNPSEGGRLG